MFGLNLLRKTTQEDFCLKQIAEMQERYNALSDEHNALLEKNLLNSRSSNVSVNFANDNIFSIERVFDDDDEFRTIIGYFDKKGRAREWYLYISSERHEELVKQFNTVNNIKVG